MPFRFEYSHPVYLGWKVEGWRDFLQVQILTFHIAGKGKGCPSGLNAHIPYSLEVKGMRMPFVFEYYIPYSWEVKGISFGFDAHIPRLGSGGMSIGFEYSHPV